MSNEIRKESMMESAKRKAGAMLSQANRKIETFTPENELNRRTYNNLNEAKLVMLTEKYGAPKVRAWIIQNGGG